MKTDMAWLFLWLLSRPCLQYATRQCEGLWGGIWKVEGQPYDVSHTDPDWAQHAMVCLQCCHHHRLPGCWPWWVCWLLCCNPHWHVYLSHIEQYAQHKCALCSLGDCLLDQPQKLLALPEDPPGVSYSLSRQCELAFGSGSKPCPYMQACSKLWCTGKAKGQLVCQTRHFPWADGTTCGSNKLCYRGICTDRQNTTKDKVSDIQYLTAHKCSWFVSHPWIFK